MSADNASAVLHITAAAGGGADRYIRDLAASTARRHFVLHVGQAVDVLEDIGNRSFLPLSWAANDDGGGSLARWLRTVGIGLAHLHGVDDSSRARLAALLRADPLPYVVTLHDLLFLNRQAFESPGMPTADPVWIAELAGTLRRASTVIAPSAFIRDIALDCLPGIRVAVIPPGIRVPPPSPAPPAPPDFVAQRPRHLVAVVGAVGPHKGSGVLDAVAEALAAGEVGIAVIGYTDTALTRGWVLPGRLYVHGPYVDDALPGWLESYGAELVLFPNRLPESFSYTLSEVWAAGLPVVVPNQGALGERVASQGGGWCLAAGFTGADVATLLGRLFSPEGAGERARVESGISPLDTARIPTLEAMSRDVDALYARYALPPAPELDADAARDALVPLLAANLDGFVFRKELLSLAGQLEQAKAAVAEAQRWSAKLEHDGAAWAAKLEADIAALRRDHAAEVARLAKENRPNARLADDNRRLARQNARLDADNRRLNDQNAVLTADNRRLGNDNGRLDEDNRRLCQLAAQLDELKATLDEAQQRSAQQERERAEQTAQHKEEVAAQRGEHARDVERLAEETRRLTLQIGLLTEDNHRLAEEIARLTEEAHRLADEINRLARYKVAFELLPEMVQKYLLRDLVRARR